MSEHTDAVSAQYRAAVERRLQGAPDAVRALLQARGLVVGVTDEPPAAAMPAAPAVRARPRAQPVKPPTPLGALNQHIADLTGLPTGARSELKSARAFRETWSRICAEDEVVQAEQRGPENAGPLNSHMLVLRTLGLLRECSPDYLRRFLAQADTLLWLEQASARLKPSPQKTRAARPKS